MTRVRRLLTHPLESHLLFPGFALLLTAIIWLGTAYIIGIEENAADNATRATVRELTETYESQVLRALREIDQHLNVVRYAYQQHGPKQALAELDNRNLLPPEFLFTVSLIGDNQELLASSGPDTGLAIDPEYLDQHRQGNRFYIAEPRRSPDSNSWMLQFSRPLQDSQGNFDGIVAITVAADFFVSSYDAARLGQQGLLGIVGTDDGVVRVRRSGDTVTAGEHIKFSRLMTGDRVNDTWLHVSESPDDGIERYFGVRELFDYPLAVIVSLSAEEQFAPVARQAGSYRLRSAIGNSVLLLIIALLWRMQHKLNQSRHREAEARLAHARQVEHLAYHDSLTGLPNRSLFSKLLEQSIREAQRYEHKLAVLFLDLDRFKHINDTLGHDAGDDLLKEVATRLKGCLRDSDTVARMGGDEFVVLLPVLNDENYADTVARKMLTAVSRPFKLAGQDYRITVSIGISTYPHDGLDEQSLTKSADTAMYHAKQHGKNNFQRFSQQLHTESLQRLTLESSLEHALELNQFRLFYQARWDTENKQISGMEALLRWEHPDLGIIAPLEFIPIAEETGQMLAIGRWVLNTACEQNMAWQRSGFAPLPMSVNLTSQQFFDPELPGMVAQALSESGMDPALLELEINESLLMPDIKRALAILRKLKQLGVRIAIDDFGVGYSSLAMLHEFPLDAIKIDRSLVREISQTEDHRALADAVVAMGQSLSLTVVAQGVETREQLDYLRAHQCREMQGFYFNQPIPPEQMTALLSNPDKQVQPLMTPREISDN